MTTTDRMPRMRFDFHPRRAVDVLIDGPMTSSDGGLVLLRQMDEQLGLTAGLVPEIPHPQRCAQSHQSACEAAALDDHLQVFVRSQ